MPQIVAADNPELATKMVEQYLQGGGQESESAAPAPLRAMSTPKSVDSYFELPIGQLTMTGDVIRTAEVKELTGLDEEIIGRASSLAGTYSAILQRGVVSLGDTKPTRQSFEDMLIADRDSLILAVRCVTYGSDLEFTNLWCDTCKERSDITVDLIHDVPVNRVSDVSEREWEVELPSGKVAVMELPNGAAQRELLDNPTWSTPEMTTSLLAHCVSSIDGSPLVDEKTVRALTGKDRQALMDSLRERDYGPRLNEIDKPCPNCGDDIRLPEVSLGTLFPA